MSVIASGYVQEFIRKIPPNVPRTFHNEYSQAANLTVNVVQEFNAIGLDIAIINRGIVALTMQIDSKTTITISAGAAFNLTNTVYGLIQIVSAVQFELVLAGRHIA